MKKNNEINQNYIALIEQAKEGFYYKSKFENKKFFEKSFLICRSNEEEIDDSDKDLNNEYYELNQGDLIKLGRMYIKIREICILIEKLISFVSSKIVLVISMII